MIHYLYKSSLTLLISTGICCQPALAFDQAGDDATAADSTIPMDADLLRRLESGEVIVETQSASTEGASAVAWVLIHAPVESVWKTIISCEQAAQFVAGLKECEVLQETGDYALTRQVVDKGWHTPKLDYTFSTRRESYRRMDVELASGNLRKLKGDWTFVPAKDGIVLQHRLEIRPPVPVPRWLVRRNLRRDLPEMLICIRGLVSGSGSAEASERERAQCPGSKS